MEKFSEIIMKKLSHKNAAQPYSRENLPTFFTYSSEKKPPICMFLHLLRAKSRAVVREGAGVALAPPFGSSVNPIPRGGKLCPPHYC